MKKYKQGVNKEIDLHLQEAVKTNKFMIALFYTEEDNLHLYRFTRNFPIDQFENACKLLEDDLSKVDK